MLWGFLFYDDYSNIAFPLAGKHAFSLLWGFFYSSQIYWTFCYLSKDEQYWSVLTFLFFSSFSKSVFSLERKRKPLQFLMNFLTFLSGLSLVSSGDSLAASRHWNYWKGRLGVPYFSNDTKTKVLATLGHTTYLHCVVGNLGDRQVNIFPFQSFTNLPKQVS